VNPRHLLFVSLFLFGVALSAPCQQQISAAEAKNHIGENATVCGKVASIHWATSSRGEPTFINLDAPYPRQVFTVLIWGSDRPKFGDVEQRYSGKRLCATGNIAEYKGVPEIIVHDPSALRQSQ
jgi:hypothetical protein